MLNEDWESPSWRPRRRVVSEVTGGKVPFETLKHLVGKSSVHLNTWAKEEVRDGHKPSLKRRFQKPKEVLSLLSKQSSRLHVQSTWKYNTGWVSNWWYSLPSEKDWRGSPSMNLEWVSRCEVWWIQWVPYCHLMFLNTMSPVGGSVWEGYGRRSALLKEEHHCGKVWRDYGFPHFLLPVSASCVWMEMWSAGFLLWPPASVPHYYYGLSL